MKFNGVLNLIAGILLIISSLILGVTYAGIPGLAGYIIGTITGGIVSIIGGVQLINNANRLNDVEGKCDYLAQEMVKTNHMSFQNENTTPENYSSIYRKPSFLPKTRMCSKCGATLDSSGYCNVCGTKVDASSNSESSNDNNDTNFYNTRKRRYCKKCGSLLDITGYCSDCGTQN